MHPNKVWLAKLLANFIIADDWANVGKRNELEWASSHGAAELHINPMPENTLSSIQRSNPINHQLQDDKYLHMHPIDGSGRVPCCK